MEHYFNNKVVELLAPAGTFEIFQNIVKEGCDAIYFGAKNLNMRLHRKNYNFEDKELFEAAKIAHSHGKKVYITVNNMYSDGELEELKELLLLLGDVKPDALIVQDFATIALLKELEIDIPVHSSVMMNVHNLEMIQALREMGVSRVVLSRELSLAYSKYLSGVTDMELEYFIHGDMCVTHGGRCLYSGMLFGQSSNRGRCLKPCRWNYNVVQNGKSYDTKFPLAVKDMCMYENIPELIEGGITSFKMEGRMRSLDYLQMLIRIYRDSIDRYLDDPLCYDRKKDSNLLHENRKRDTSVAYAFGNPGLSNINERYEGTGALYSSGKMFSIATEERGITQEAIDKINERLMTNDGQKEERLASADKLSVAGKGKLCIKVNNIRQAQICLEHEVDEIYLSGDVFKPDKPFSKQEIAGLCQEKGKSKIYLSLPHMMFDRQMEEYQQFLAGFSGLDGVMVTNLGAVKAFGEYELIGDYPLNLLNSKAAELFLGLGLNRITISPEATLEEMLSLIRRLGEKAELIVHGSPTVMYMEHNLYENTDGETTDSLHLKDEKGMEHPVYMDQHGRNHMLLYKPLCYLPLAKGLLEAGLCYFRIEGMYLSEKDLIEVIKGYQCAMKNPEIYEQNYKAGFMQKNYSFGSLEF